LDLCASESINWNWVSNLAICCNTFHGTLWQNTKLYHVGPTPGYPTADVPSSSPAYRVQKCVSDVLGFCFWICCKRNSERSKESKASRPWRMRWLSEKTNLALRNLHVKKQSFTYCIWIELQTAVALWDLPNLLSCQRMLRTAQVSCGRMGWAMRWAGASWKSYQSRDDTQWYIMIQLWYIYNLIIYLKSWSWLARRSWILKSLLMQQAKKGTTGTLRGRLVRNISYWSKPTQVTQAIYIYKCRRDHRMTETIETRTQSVLLVLSTRMQNGMERRLSSRNRHPSSGAKLGFKNVSK